MWAYIQSKPTKNQIEQYILTGTVLKGIVPVFVSTEIRISLSEPLFPNCIISNLHFDIDGVHSFLFLQKEDKPHFRFPYRVRCRSPPNPMKNNFLKKLFQTVQVLHSLSFMMDLQPQTRGGVKDESSKS